jgi:lipopolysaccharide/colanic/teichoic acid biosynthesis glycosyltransferase
MHVAALRSKAVPRRVLTRSARDGHGRRTSQRHDLIGRAIHHDFCGSHLINGKFWLDTAPWSWEGDDRGVCGGEAGRFHRKWLECNVPLETIAPVIPDTGAAGEEVSRGRSDYGHLKGLDTNAVDDLPRPRDRSNGRSNGRSNRYETLPARVSVDLRTRELIIDLTEHTFGRTESGASDVALLQPAGSLVRLTRRPVAERTKRVLETIMVLASSVVWLPVLVLLVALVKCTSRGPAFYVQRRIGRNSSELSCMKLRTMVVDADSRLDAMLAAHPELREEYESTFKLRRDPRVTRVGRILRISGLDELPQLFSVLTGKMALVGPRPITAKEISFYSVYLPVVLSVRPGLTGLWQVSGRNNISYPARVAYDVQYAITRTLWSDLAIIAKTILLVFSPSRRGAY